MKALQFISHIYAKITLIGILVIASTATATAVVTTEVSGTIGATVVTDEQEWHIVGDLYLSGEIKVNEGAKLTIINTTDAPVTIRHAEGTLNVFFANLGELHLGDNSSERIIIDGGSTFDWDVDAHKLLPESSKAVQSPTLFGQLGLMYMNNVTITNFCGRAYNPAIICQTLNKTFIDNCLFEKCYGAQVSCIIVNSADSNLDPETSAISISNTTFRHCEGGTEYNDNLGLGYNCSGIIRIIGIATSNISLKNVIIKDNYLAGGGIVCNLSFKGKLTVDGCTISGNRVGSYGAGIWSEGAFEATGTPTIIEDNYAAKGGGGFTITTYGGEWKFKANRTYNFNDKLIIRNNRTDGIGGGVCVLFNEKTSLEAGSTFDINFNGATIEQNTANVSGGGIYFQNKTPADKDYTFKTNLNGGKISNNTAPIGAGIYAETIDVGHSISGDDVCTIDGNIASAEGAGIYIKGANISLNSADVSSNKADTDGGGIYLEGGTLTMTSGDIHNNTCGQKGGGVYITNTAIDNINSTFSGGKIYANDARNGGGICANGNVTLTISNSSIYNNTAKNGGGICVIGGANMTYKNGLIRNNKAVSNTVYNTGYKMSETEIEGFGGGVFVAGTAEKESKLTFDMSESVNTFGLYGNAAGNGGDDIFTTGNGTSVTIPKVSGMTLSEFNVPVAENALFWAEDYATNDPNYGEGTKSNTEWTGTNVRYQYALNNILKTYSVPTPQTLTKYTSLALGYGVVFVTIEKIGLNEGESAIFEITKDGATEPYMRLLLTGKKNPDGTLQKVSQIVALVPGKWNVKETNWSWTYSSNQPINGITKEIINESSDKVFTFVNTKKSNLSPNGESIVKNQF